MIKEFGTKKPKSLEDKIDNLARAMATGFSSLQDTMDTRFSTVEHRLQNLEEGQQKLRSDILALHDKFPSNQKFDALTVRVSKLEAKSRR